MPDLPLPHQTPYRTPPEVRRPARAFSSVVFHARLIRLGLLTCRRIENGVLSEEATQEFCRGVLRILEELGGRCEFDGAENFARVPGPHVFASNHLSLLDPVALQAIIQPHRPIVAVASRHLRLVPVLGALLQARRTIWVGRGSPRADLMTVYAEGAAHLRAGRSVMVFPQSTRRPRFQPHGFNSLAVKLAKRVGVPVCAVAVKTDAWAIGRVVRTLGTIHPERVTRVAFDSPRHVMPNDRPQRAELIRFIVRRHEEWGLPIDRSRPAPWWLRGEPEIIDRKTAPRG